MLYMYVCKLLISIDSLLMFINSNIRFKSFNYELHKLCYILRIEKEVQFEGFIYK